MKSRKVAFEINSLEESSSERMVPIIQSSYCRISTVCTQHHKELWTKAHLGY